VVQLCKTLCGSSEQGISSPGCAPARRRSWTAGAASSDWHFAAAVSFIETMALVREACRRTVGLVPFVEQLAGGYGLLFDAAVEMDKGKTLTTLIPGSIRALVGRAVHVLLGQAVSMLRAPRLQKVPSARLREPHRAL
jgi:hypothetical protein